MVYQILILFIVFEVLLYYLCLGLPSCHITHFVSPYQTLSSSFLQYLATTLQINVFNFSSFPLNLASLRTKTWLRRPFLGLRLSCCRPFISRIWKSPSRWSTQTAWYNLQRARHRNKWCVPAFVQGAATVWATPSPRKLPHLPCSALENNPDCDTDG